MDFNALLMLGNAGTPLMWAGCFHLTLGNTALGTAEAWVLSRFYGVPPARAAWLMIGANYFSALFGFWITSMASSSIIQWDIFQPYLYFAPIILLLAVVALYLLTIILELPFVYLAETEGKRSWATALGRSIAVQTISYPLLIAIYALTSNVSLYTRGRILLEPNFFEPTPAWIYFITGDGNQIARIRPDGSEEEVMVGGVDHTTRYRLFPRANDEGRWDLVLKELYARRHEEDPGRVMITSFAGHCALPHGADAESLEDRDYLYRHMRWAADFREPLDQQSLKIRNHMSYGQYMDVYREGGEKELLSSEAPFMALSFSNVTILPTEQVILQIGREIVLFDPETRKFATITRGESPVVAYDLTPESEKESTND